MRGASAGLWHWSVAEDEFWWSQELCRMCGVDPCGPTSLDAFVALVHTDDREEFRVALEEALRRGQPATISHRVAAPDGSTRILRHDVMAMIAGQGQSARVFGAAQDAAAGRRAHETLAVLSSAVEQAADLVLITDRSGRILYANPAFLTFSGFDREELVGATPRILKSGHHDVAFYKDLWSSLLDGRVWRGVLQNRRKGGSLYYEEKTIAPLRDDDGHITRFVSVGRDVTERHRGEEAQESLKRALQDAVRAWRATFDAVDAPMIVVDGSGTIRRLNEAARFLLRQDFGALIGLPVASLPQEQPWIAMVAASVTGGEAEPGGEQVRDSLGRTWDVVGQRMPDWNGAPSGAVVVARDVTEMLRLQESLRRNERMSGVGSLLASVAHEVRNPLFGISATLEAFEAEFSGRPEYLEYTSRLRSQVERLTGLMHDLLELGRPGPASFEPASILEPLARARQACQALASRAGVELLLDGMGELPDVAMDFCRLQQVFQNLIENAVQHSAPGRAVRMRVCRDATGFVRVSIADEGPGFAPDDLARAFEPFYTRRPGGTGLGLSIVRKLVDEHGGRVRATNRPGAGAEVVVLLPAHASLLGGHAAEPRADEAGCE